MKLWLEAMVPGEPSAISARTGVRRNAQGGPFSGMAID
jgi:hypothetical protein